MNDFVGDILIPVLTILSSFAGAFLQTQHRLDLHHLVGKEIDLLNSAPDEIDTSPLQRIVQERINILGSPPKRSPKGMAVGLACIAVASLVLFLILSETFWNIDTVGLWIVFGFTLTFGIFEFIESIQKRPRHK